MKSVTQVAFIGSWLRSSLTSRPRKSCELIVLEGRLEETLLEDVAEFVPETVMRNSGSLRRLGAALSADCSLEGRLQIKRMASRIQARIHAAESIENAAEFAAWPACNEVSSARANERSRRRNRRDQSSECSGFRERKSRMQPRRPARR